MKIGNLSRSVIKVPDFFLLSKDPTENVLQVPCPYRKYNVFREKDFFRFSPLASLNFNRNKRLKVGESNYIYKPPTFEELLGIRYEEKEKETESEKEKNTHTEESFKKKTKTEPTKLNRTKDILVKTTLSNPSSVEEFSNTVRTNMNNLLNKINQDINNYDENAFKLKSNSRNFKIKSRIPQLNEKSKDTMYKEAIDYTVDHLHLISPTVKYQINNRYSNILGRRDYDRILNYLPHYDTDIQEFENEKVPISE
jgi:hypothetical protein